MKDIKWEDGADCYADGKQWSHFDNHLLTNDKWNLASREEIVQYPDFQLNEIRQGDCISASELDTEQKYNDAVEVFELFGVDCGDYAWFKYEASRYNKFVCEDGELDSCVNKYGGCYRKITYSQLMAIGKLKRAMIGREDYLSKTKNLCDLDILDYYSSRILGSMSQPTASFIIPSDCGIDSESVDKDTKESKAYDLLKSMNISYDEEKEKWYKKEYL